MWFYWLKLAKSPIIAHQLDFYWNYYSSTGFLLELSTCLYTFWIYLYQWLLHQCSLHITSDLYTLLDDFLDLTLLGYQWPQLSLCLCHIHGDKRMCQKSNPLYNTLTSNHQEKFNTNIKTMDYFSLIDQLDLISLHLEYREPSLISPIEDHEQGNNSYTRSTPKFHRKGL